MTNTEYYETQLNRVKVGMTVYPPAFKIFANTNGEDTNHLSLNNESAKVLIEWLKNNFPDCLD